MSTPFDPTGRFGPYGGAYVPETLVGPLTELVTAWTAIRHDPAFLDEFETLLTTWSGRPTPLTEASRLAARVGAKVIRIKREDLNHTGAHKINNALGQALLARRMGKRRIVAETGAGQHGVAAATVCARLGLSCVVYMGEVDAARQELNVYRMKILGAEVRTVTSGSRTLKDAVNEAMRDWVAHVGDTHYLLGSALGPHPYPTLVREFQSMIGREARRQWLSRDPDLPDLAVACVGGGSNAIGLFDAFRDDPVTLVGVEAGGEGPALGQHAARFLGGREGVLHGTRTWVLQDEDGQIAETTSISAGLDYPAIGPEHAWLRAEGRAEYYAASDQEALWGFRALAETEGIIPALESAHAIGWMLREHQRLAGATILLNLSGRGDKDVAHVAAIEGASP